MICHTVLLLLLLQHAWSVWEISRVIHIKDIEPSMV